MRDKNVKAQAMVLAAGLGKRMLQIFKNDYLQLIETDTAKRSRAISEYDEML